MSNIYDTSGNLWTKVQAAKDIELANNDGGKSSFGGGDGSGGSLNERLTALEVRFEYVRDDLQSIKSGQVDINRTLSDVSFSLKDLDGTLKSHKLELTTSVAALPTKNDLRSWKLQWTALGVAIVAIVVGGIIGGLGWIQAMGSPAPPSIVEGPAKGV